MARLVGTMYTSHGGFTITPSDRWAARRQTRSYRPDVPVESQAEMDQKWARTLSAIAELRTRLESLRPDLLVVVGDDQEECFTFANHPSIAVYVGGSFAGTVPPSGSGSANSSMTAPGHPGLAKHLLLGLLDAGFDPAFMTELPRPDRGMSHAVMHPLVFLTDFDLPTVPLLINAYYAPQITARRCLSLGRAVKELVASYPEDARVVVVGSGGLWHTPGQPASWLNESFDRALLESLERGDVEEWSALFDSYVPAPDDPSQEIATKRSGVSGLPGRGGPQFGTRESLCWVVAAAASEGHKAVVVDYIPIYASPVGNGFAYCEVAD
jgi:hypothetical protein